MSSVKGKIEWNLKHTYSIYIYIYIYSLFSTKTKNRENESWWKHRTSKYQLLVFSSCFQFIDWITLFKQLISTPLKQQAFCPLGDAIRPKAKQTEIRAAGFIHHPWDQQGWKSCRRCNANKLEYDWISIKGTKVFIFSCYEDTQTHVKR